MKVILIKDVARLGRKTEIKDVPSGHALNFLIPRKLAVIATPESIKRVSEQISKVGEQKQQSEDSFAEAVQKLADGTVKYSADSNEQGHLFKGIHTNDIAAHLASQNIAITENHIQLEHAIKDLGIHEISLAYNGKKGMFRLEVVKK